MSKTPLIYVDSTGFDEVTSILDFDVTLIWDRTKDPQTRSDGSVPKQDDFQLLLTLGVDM